VLGRIDPIDPGAEHRDRPASTRERRAVRRRVDADREPWTTRRRAAQRAATRAPPPP
jgi:hypothetical protein